MNIEYIEQDLIEQLLLLFLMDIEPSCSNQFHYLTPCNCKININDHINKSNHNNIKKST
jgi:hypothetical protein